MIDLRAGNLYNVVISLLVFLGCAYASFSIFSRGRKSLPEKTFSLFVSAVGLYWLLISLSNLLAWLNLLGRLGHLVYLVKFVSVFPLIFLAHYLCGEIFASRTAVRRTTFLYALVAVAYLLTTFRLDGAQSISSYWGVQWMVSELPLVIYVLGMLFPLALISAYFILNNLLLGIFGKKSENLTLYFSALIFVLVEYLQISYAAVTWQRLLARLLYILIAFGAYLYFIGRVEEDRFIPRDEEPPPRRLPRISFFVKLLLLFVLLAVLPITISFLLMFVSFREIIDIYVYKPLLWDLRTSREAFILALDHVQVQALFLMLLTGLLVFVASVLASRAIAETLRSISEGMGRVSKGDFSFKIRRDSNDEIGDVINYFNEMSVEIKRSREVMQNWSRELEVKVAERTEDLRILYDVSKAVGSSLDLELLIGRAVERLLPIMKAETYAILIPDEKGYFRPRICRGCDLKEMAVEEGKWPAGWMVTPLRAKGRTVGALMIKGRKLPDERAANLLSTVSDQLAVAVENVGIYEKEKEAVARLTELDRLKNEFISMVSHELRTPVTSVDGYVSLFLTGSVGPLSEDQKKYLAIVKENDQRLLTLINRLLDFSRIETGRFSIERKLISMHDIVRNVVSNMKPQIEKKKAEVRMDLSARHFNFMGDRSKMEGVLVNMIENALKFGPEEGPLKIEIKTRDEGDFLRVEVADNGVGIEKKHLEKIFNKFYQIEETLTRKAGGVGLGLALAQEIIGNHHGKIWAESEGRGKGSKFLFEVPVAEKA